MNESDYQSLLGGYVSDLLDAGEHDAVQTHLRACPTCRHEADQLAAVARGLRRAGESRNAMNAADLAPPEDWAQLDLAQLETDGARLDNDLILQRTLRTLRSERARGQRGRVLAIAAAVAVLLGAGGAIGAAVGAREHSPTAAAVSTVPGTRTVSGRDPDTRVRMVADIVPQAGFSRFSAHVTDEPPNARCQLIAIANNGRHAVVSSWAVGPHGSGATGTHVTGSVAIPATELRQLEIRTLTNTHIITINLT